MGRYQKYRAFALSLYFVFVNVGNVGLQRRGLREPPPAVGALVGFLSAVHSAANLRVRPRLKPFAADRAVEGAEPGMVHHVLP